MKEPVKTTFVPMLAISGGTMELSFYQRAFGAIELRRWSNEDGSIHVAELSIDGAMFHFHEEKPEAGIFNPERAGGVTTTIGLMVADVDTIMARALAAGARETSPAQDYDYGYRQGEIIDPLGHRWMIEAVI
ncbi:MAG TPA: VOC family protein [Puia sp.]